MEDKKNYWIQVNDYMNPVKVELTNEEVKTVIYVLKTIAKGDKKACVAIDDDCDQTLYTNYNEWVKNIK